MNVVVHSLIYLFCFRYCNSVQENSLKSLEKAKRQIDKIEIWMYR